MTGYSAPQGFRWQLAGDILPPVSSILPVAEAIRSDVHRRAQSQGVWPLPDVLNIASSDPNPCHAHWLPEDLDGDGLIDHVLLCIPAGLPERILPVLAQSSLVRLTHGIAPSMGPWRLLPVWMGALLATGLAGPAAVWHGITPYVAPLRDREERDSMIRQDLQRRGFPLPAAIAWQDHCEIEARSFARHSLGPPRLSRRGAEITFVDLHFSEPVTGPLALGFGAHFGMGLFMPSGPEEDGTLHFEEADGW